jgi:methylmalonyl-CoA/ethylmalonyl-CoA epimerase
MLSFMSSVKQVGYAVKDLDRTLRDFEAMNGKDHAFWRFQTTMDAACGYRYRDRPAVCRLDIALTTINGMDHEFIQALSGDHPAGDFVEAHGDGINHLALYLADLTAYRDRALSLGGGIVAQGEFAEGTSPARRFAYIGFEGQPSPLYELVELRSLAQP